MFHTKAHKVIPMGVSNVIPLKMDSLDLHPNLIK